MSTRLTAIAAGLAAYVALVLVFYGLHRLAFGGGGGPYPLWYSVGELLVNSLKAVVPGIVVGWLQGNRALRTGAAVGAIGGVTEVVLLSVLTGFPPAEWLGRMVVAILVTAVTSAFTNAVGAAAGRFVHEHAKPSNPTFERDAPQAARPSP